MIGTQRQQNMESRTKRETQEPNPPTGQDVQTEGVPQAKRHYSADKQDCIRESINVVTQHPPALGVLG